MRYAELLNEMVVRYRPEGDSDMVIAHRDSIWLLSDPYSNEPSEEVLDDIRERTGLVGDDLDTMLDDAREARPDVLLGTLHNGTLYIDGAVSITPNPASSLLVKKVCRQLGITNVGVNRLDHEGGEYTDDYHRREMIGRIPDVVYHGTNTRFLNQIMRTGLNGDNPHANWENAGKFRGKLFLTANPRDAMFHANRQAEQRNAAPVVLAVRIPDRSKIVPDFDVAATMYGADHEVAQKHGYDRAIASHYGNTEAGRIQAHSPKTDFTREIGIFAYTGRIPPAMFQYMYVPSQEDGGPMSHENLVKVEPADFRDALDMLDEFGFYDPIYRDEMNSYDEDEEEFDDEDEDRYP